MITLILTALLVGGATILGGSVGLFVGRTTKKFCDASLSLAAGVMLAAAIIGLILPSVEQGGSLGVILTVFGIFGGAMCVHFLDVILALVPSLRCEGQGDSFRRAVLFVLAISLHNFPEGVAAGVGMGGCPFSEGIMIATAIAIQNLPEGLIVAVTLRGIGVGRLKSCGIAALTGVVEIIGCFLGYYAVTLSAALLPLILAMAGGAMLYVISEEMIPETHKESESKSSTYLLLCGFCFMLLFNSIL